MKEIVVVQSGWVLMGDVQEEENVLVLKSASVIRVWGTTRGLGQIALNGPTKDTVLDPCGEATVPKIAVLFRIKCVK